MIIHPLKRNKIHLKIRLLLSACFFLFSNSLFSQNKWEAVPGVRVNGIVSEIVIDSVNNNLVIGGHYINRVNGQSSCPVFKWSPENGVEILDTSGSPQMHVYAVNDIVISNDSILVGGGEGLTIYKNNSWIKKFYGNGNSMLWDIYPYHNKYLLSTGLGSRFDNKPIGQLIEWDGGSGVFEFQNVTSFMQPDPAIMVALEYKNELYVGGSSNSDYGGIMDEIMKWDGTHWQKVGDGIQRSNPLSVVYDMAIYKNELYVAGQFTQDGPIKENHIARWDGNQWKTVGGGIQDDIFGWSVIRELHVYNGYLFAGGRFGGAGGVPTQGVARWDGYEWCGCGSEILMEVESLTHFRDTLYIGGNFLQIYGNDSIDTFARFIGSDFADTCGSSAVGIKTVATQNTALIGYPNPVKNVLNLEMPIMPSGPVSYLIYNNVGQLVLQREKYGNDNKIQLNVSSLSKGVYFGKVIADQSNYVFSFVKD